MDNHKGEEMKGRVKEAAGNIADDKDLERDGRSDKRSAKVKRTVDNAADKLKDAVDND